MKKRLKQLIGFFLVLSLVMTSISVSAFAETADPSYVKEGSYSYASNIGYVQIPDRFTYRDDCFTRSSFLGCNHLSVLSAQVSLASYGHFGNGQTADYEAGSKNITKMLANMGFSDVETNKYYRQVAQEDSMAVAVGHRTIIAYGRTYTLLAIFPRSSGYLQEWYGNCEAGSGDIHEGFKAARDEVLRFVKSYINRHGINGDLKVWTAGHSRGATVANMVGAFFAGGGIDYFGDNVSIQSEDVYCYTYAALQTVKAGVSKNKELTVSAARGGDYANKDTVQAQWNYIRGGTLNPQDAVYSGLKNFVSEYDVVSLLVPSSWGYARYGTDFYVHDYAYEDNMWEKLFTVNSLIYLQNFQSGDYRTFQRKRFDSGATAIVDDTGYPFAVGWNGFLNERIEALSSLLEYSNANFATKGYQTGGASAASLAAMLDGFYLDGLSLESFSLDSDLISLIDPNLIIGAVYGYFAYGSKKLQAEGRASSAAQATKIIIEEMSEYIGGSTLNLSSSTVDDLLLSASDTLASNEDSVYGRIILEFLAAEIPENNMESFLELAGKFHAGMDYANPPEVKTLIMDLFDAFANGAEAGTEAAQDEFLNTPSGARKALYDLMVRSLQDEIPDIAGMIGVDEDTEEVIGSSSASDLIDKLIPAIAKLQVGVLFGGDAWLERKADESLSSAIENMLKAPMNSAGNFYGNEYYQALQKHLKNMQEYITEERELAFAFLFDTPNEPFSVESSMNTAITLFWNISFLAPAHFGETYLAWMEAISQYGVLFDDHSITKQSKIKATMEKDGNIQYWSVYDSADATGDTRYYSDSALTKEIELSEAAIPKIKTIQLSGTSYSYNGKTKRPTVTVYDRTGKQIDSVGYTVTYSNVNSRNAGTYDVTVKFKGNYSGTKKLSYTIKKVSNTITNVTSSKTLSYKELKKGNKTFNIAATVKGGAKKTFKATSIPKKAKNYITVSTNGKVTVKKGLKKGTYTISVKITAAQTTNYKTASAVKKIKIVVK